MPDDLASILSQGTGWDWGRESDNVVDRRNLPSMEQISKYSRGPLAQSLSWYNLQRGMLPNYRANYNGLASVPGSVPNNGMLPEPSADAYYGPPQSNAMAAGGIDWEAIRKQLGK